VTELLDVHIRKLDDLPEESSLIDAPQNANVAEQQEVTYTVVKMEHRKAVTLTDSLGHCYSVKPLQERSDYWRCVVRSKSTNCRAKVIETNNVLERHSPHICCPRPVLSRSKITGHGQ